MDQKAVFLKFWEKEAPATRKVISRIPEGSEYRPDPKARTAREIAWLIVREEVVLGEGFENGALDWAEIPAPATVAEILDVYDRHHEVGTRNMRNAPVARWDGQLPFRFQGQEAFSASGYDQAWGFFFDIIHHRGQLSTYLRPMGSTVPQIYGPTADEPGT
jgi:DinB family